MSDSPVDEIDRQILSLLQEEARNNTNAEISDRVGVSPSTIGKRIKRLEEAGIIKGYHPDIDYDRAGLPLRVLFICTTPITDRSDLIQRAIQLPGVVNVKELMNGRENVHIEVVGDHNDEITRLATAIDDLGIAINEEVLVKNDYPQPASIFRSAETE
jgi:DNA-binding Lrp family transcriptional regulator